MAKAGKRTASNAALDDAAAPDPKSVCTRDDACPICMTDFSDKDGITLDLQCCGQRVCHACVCAHTIQKGLVDKGDGKGRAKCPFCRGEFISGSNQLVVVFNRLACEACNGNVAHFDKSCTNPECGQFRKRSWDTGIHHREGRFHWIFTAVPAGMKRTDTDLEVAFLESVLFSLNSGPTWPSSKYVLHPDGTVSHVHSNGKVQAWGLAPPQWFPLMPSAISLFPARSP